MKKCHYVILLLIFFSLKVNGQSITQTFVDRCTGEIKTATIQYVSGSAIVSFYNQTKTFTSIEVQTGVTQTWLNSVYNTYANLSCATNPVIQQAVQQSAQQTTQQTVTQAASAAASSAANSSASSATSSSVTSVSSTAPTSSSNSSSSNTSSSESKTESKTESKSEESKSDEKKEDKKKQQNLNPLLLGSDLTTTQSLDGRFSTILSVGVSKSSMAGDVSYGANAMIWSTLNQYVISGNYTKMKFQDGQLKGVHSYGSTIGYLKGAWMLLNSYTYVIPNPKRGTYGYNVGTITLLTKGSEKKRDINLSSSFVAFWTKPYQCSKKIILSPQVFVMTSPLSFAPSVGYSSINRNLGFLLGSSFDYKISKRFGFSFNYKLNVNTTKRIPILHNFLIGSRMIL